MTELLKLEIKNLFSFKEATLDLEKRGLLLITGYSEDEQDSNGAGKSSLANKSILYALFGKTAGKIAADKVINNKVENEQTYAKLSIRTSENILVDIIRSRNPVSVILRNTTNNNIISVGEGSTDRIYTILGSDFKTFTASSVFGQGIRTSYLNLTAEKQKEFLESILPMDSIEVWANRTKDYTNKIKASVKTESENLLVYKTTDHTLSVQYSTIHDQSTQWDTQKTIKLTTLMRLQKDEISRIRTVNEEIQKLSEEQSKFNLLPEKEIQILADECLALEHQIQPLVEQWELEQSKYNRLLAHISKLKDLTWREIDSNCPTCNQLLPQDKLQELLDTRASQLQGLEEMKVEEIKQKNLVNSLTQKLENLRNEINEIENKIDDNSYFKHKYQELETKILQLKANNHDKSKDLESQFNQVSEESNPFEPTLERLQKQIRENKERIGNTEQKIKDLNEEILHLEFWKATISTDIRLKMLEAALAFLNQRISVHLKGLNNSQISVKFSTKKEQLDGEKDEISYTVSSSTGGSNFDSLSGGEQQIVNFAVGLAISDLINAQTASPCNLLILDEPFAMLGKTNSSRVVTYLTELLKQKSTILLISNDEELMSLIPNRIHVIKNKGISYVRGG